MNINNNCKEDLIIYTKYPTELSGKTGYARLSVERINELRSNELTALMKSILRVVLVFSIFAGVQVFAQTQTVEGSEVALQEATARVAEGDFMAALRVVKKELVANPKNVDALILEGEVLLSTSRSREAAESFNKVLELNEASSEKPNQGALVGLAKVDIENTDYDAAQRQLLFVVKEYPNNAEAYYLLGRVDFNLKYFANAVKSLRKAYFLDPSKAPEGFDELREEAIANLESADARTYAEDDTQLKKIDKSKKGDIRLEKRKKLDPTVFNRFEFPSASEDNLEIYELLKVSDSEVEELTTEVVEMYNDAMLLFGDKKFEETVANVEGMLSLAPDFYQAIYLHGLAKVQMEDYLVAEFSFNSVISINPYIGRAYLWRSIVREKNGNYEDAADDLVLARKYALRDRDSYVIAKTSALIFELSKRGVISEFTEVEHVEQVSKKDDEPVRDEELNEEEQQLASSAKEDEGMEKSKEGMVEEVALKLGEEVSPELEQEGSAAP